MANLYRNLRLPILVLALCCATRDGARGGEDSQLPCWHRVRGGETLAKIARRYYGRTSAWKRIKQANPGLNERNLEIGQRILIPAPHGSARPPQPEPVPTPTPPEDPPEKKLPEEDLPAGEVAQEILSSLIGFVISFFAACLLLWWTSKLLRNPLRLQNTSFKRAALGTLLCHVFGGLAVAGVMALCSLTFLTGMDKEMARLVWVVLTSSLGFLAYLVANCWVLARVYKTQFVGGLFLFVVWILLSIMVYCLVGAIFLGLGMLIVGGSLFALA